MEVSKLYSKIFSKLNDFFLAVGFFSEIIILILVIVLLNNNYFDLFVYIIGFNLNAIINNFLKSYIHQKRPENPVKFLNSEHFDKHKIVYGMPSGHSQNVFYSIVYLYLCTTHNIPWILLSLFIGTLMLIERWLFHNHTILQLLMGAILGSLIAFIIVYTKNNIRKTLKV